MLLGCAPGAPGPRAVEGTDGSAGAHAPQAPVAYRLFIAHPEDQRESREGGFMTVEDLRSELQTELARMPVFEHVTFDDAEPVDLELRPVIVSDRVAGQEPNAVSEVAIRFDLVPSGSSALLWSELYRETSPSDIVFQSPIPPRRQLMLAHKANRRRIVAALKADLAKTLYVF